MLLGASEQNGFRTTTPIGLLCQKRTEPGSNRRPNAREAIAFAHSIVSLALTTESYEAGRRDDRALSAPPSADLGSGEDRFGLEADACEVLTDLSSNQRLPRKNRFCLGWRAPSYRHPCPKPKSMGRPRRVSPKAHGVSVA